MYGVDVAGQYLLVSFIFSSASDKSDVLVFPSFSVNIMYIPVKLGYAKYIHL